MRTRLLLVTVMMLTAACRLSDHQQFGVGILKFAATTIASATTTPVVVPVQKEKPAVTMTCAQHRVQHIRSRVQRVMQRVIRFEMIASERPCPKVRQSALRG